jgi:aminopeptidase
MRLWYHGSIQPKRISMYTPPAETLAKYADILINFALNSGEGVKPGEVVLVRVPECAKPFYAPLRDAVIKAGAHPIMQFMADGVEIKNVFEYSSDEQLDFFPGLYWKGIIDQIDHAVMVLADADMHEMEGIDPKKIMRRSMALQPYMKWREAKEAAGKFTWTLGLYGTPAMAAEVEMSEEEYWEQITRACFLDEADPLAKWREVQTELERVRGALNAMHIDKVHIEAEGIDLWVGLGAERQWLGGSGRNIPSFELFISPDWRRTEGEIAFSQPLYHYGNKMDGIRLVFKNGVIVESSATLNEPLLKEMISAPNADKLGEFSLTDSRMSRITKLMAETLYDENIGGPFGNTHVAVGNAYKDSFPGDQASVTHERWAELGYNESAVHTDIISTADRTVTAYLPDGSTKVIYKEGKFTL